MDTEWVKRIFIILLCIVSAILTYFFHRVLNVSTVFTHFFYLPIILSAFWWQRKGLIVTAILCLILLSGHLIFGPAYLISPYNNYIRVVIFFLVSFFVIYLSEQIQHSQKSLRNQKDQLETLVRKRTKELADVNETLKRKITDLDQARDAVLQSEKQVRKIIEESPVGIRISQNGRYVFANSKFTNLFGYPSMEEILGKPVTAMVEPESAELIRKLDNDLLSGQAISTRSEFKGVKRSGELIDIAVWASTIDYQGARSILGFVVDISREKKMRHQILQSQKWESIGVLAGGIAHKFNNALTSISGSAELILAQSPPEHRMQKHLDRIQDSVRQMANLNQLLLAYARKGQLWSKPCRLNHLVRGALMLIDRQTVPCPIRTELADGLPDILADERQIQIIVTAVLQNAIEATEAGDTITVRTGGHPSGNTVTLEVEDTGCGMSPETRERIFDPFFTTHFPGRGLSMAAVYGIVKNHKGRIDVVSQLQQGTTVTIDLPSLR